MLLTEKIEYKKLERVTTAEGRKYVGDDNVPVPSVTTVLDKTSDKTALIAWRKRVGDAEANRVSKESAGLGTKVHNALEQYILGEDYEIKKEDFAQRLLKHLFNQLPQLKGKVEFYEFSTPLTAKHFSNYKQGALYGIDHNPKRFRQNFLRPKTKIIQYLVRELYLLNFNFFEKIFSKAT